MSQERLELEFDQLFCLTICLRIDQGRHDSLCAKKLCHSFPKSTCEFDITIRIELTT
jgi:hypothetical protein